MMKDSLRIGVASALRFANIALDDSVVSIDAEAGRELFLPPSIPMTLSAVLSLMDLDHFLERAD